jgi:hypothetical protein
MVDYQKIFNELEDGISEDIQDIEIRDKAIDALRDLAVWIYQGLKKGPKIVLKAGPNGAIIRDEKP